MEIQLSVATSGAYVEKLPKGAKITNFEIHHPGTNKILGKDKAGTMKQIAKRMEFLIPTGMTVDLTVCAEYEGETIKVKDKYTLKSTGLVKAV